jgi:uncharacterized membrane protein
MSLARASDAVTSRLRVLALAMVTAGIIHITATLIAPRLSGATPFVRLTPLAPLHTFAVLAPMTPQNQALPFLSPDMRYAICRYDTAKGPVTITASLPGRGWILSLYSPEGDSFYTAVGQEAQSSDLALLLTPSDDRFLGLTPEARGKATEGTNSLSITTGKGMAVLRAPDRGIAYASQTETVLKKATCSARPF